MSSQNQSDQAKKSSLDQIVATVANLGIAPDTYLEDLPPQVRTMLESYVAGYEPGDRAGALQRIWSMVGETVKTSTVDAASKTATANANADGIVTPIEQQHIDAAKKTGKANTTPSTPPWILQAAQNNGTAISSGGDIDATVAGRISKEWNTIYGTHFTYDQLVGLPQFRDATETTQKIVQGALLNVQPQIDYSVTLPGNRTVRIGKQQEIAQYGQYGFNIDDVGRVVHWADVFGLKNEKGDPTWQPLAALIKAKGLDVTSSYTDKSGFDPETGKKLARPTSQQHRHGGSGQPTPPPPDNKVAANNQLNVAMIAQAYKQNLDKFGDPSMAFLATMDQGLASRLQASGGDDTKVSEKDTHLADEYLTSGSWDPTKLHDMGYAGGTGYESFLNRLKMRSAATAPTRMTPDPQQIRNDVIDFWRTNFRADPSDATVNQFVSELQAQAAAAPKDQSVDITARLRALAEKRPEYKTLYGNIQPGQTPADYQQQFISGAQDMTGAQAPDNGAILAGMRSGDYNVTTAGVAGTSRAWTNSRFLGNLASAAQAVSAMT